MTTNKYSIYPIGDTGIIISLGDVIDEQLHNRVQRISTKLNNKNNAHIIDIVPTYNSVTIYYRSSLPYKKMKQWIIQCLEQLDSNDDELEEAKIIEIPVCYGNNFGPDLERVATLNNLTVEKVIEKHTEPLYLIYMMGFLPGFPYLGGLSNAIATPRLSSPRQKVIAGSVGIANNQTGIYPIDSPGGWNIIGKTPVSIYNPHHEQPFLFEMGTYIKFNPMTEIEYKLYINGCENE